MPLFQNSHDFVVNNAQFVDQTINYNGPSGIDILREASIHAAAHDSNARQYAPSCFPGTREQHIEDITRWAVSSLSKDSAVAPIYWMKGPAGVGKSAIAQTCAEKLKELGLLGASFFFSMNGCDDPTRFFPSIAYQLAIELPEYRDLLDKKVFNDKTLAKKTVKAQFRGLIVEPFVELERIGNMQSRRAIFVDGLDECGDKDAQREIVELVGTWVGNRSTSSCWAFFSRPEPHLESTFANPNLSPLCHVTILPISREADREIELYLRSGLENVLRRRNISLSYSWPSDREVQALVAAAAGLFIYPATLIRFMDRTCRSPEELMNIVHGSFASPGGPRTLSAEGSHQLFAELDAFYTLILRRIPVDIFPTVQLLLALAVMTPFESCVWGAVGLSNLLGFSEAKFRLVCSELHAVLHFQDYGDLSTISDLSISRIIDATRPFDISERVMMDWLRQSVSRLGGVLTFYHKSFYDFLRDPTRSQTFCVTAANVQNDLFKLRLGIHLKYADGYSTQGQDLIQVAKSSTSEDVLSWPQDIQLVDSYIKAVTFNNTGFVLLHLFCPYDHLDAQLIKQLADFDFRKHLLSQPYIFSSDYLSRSTVFGMPSMAKYVHGCAAGTLLCSIPPTLFHTFDADRFFEGIGRLEKYKIIRRMSSPDFMTGWRSRLRGKSRAGIYSGLYTKGYGEKKTFWYWELNLELRFYQEFESGCLVEGEKAYREEDFETWGYGFR